MHFYIDESGNSGKNIFDKNQPFLYYGVLASKTDIDTQEQYHIEKMRDILRTKRIHAKEIREKGIEIISNNIMEIIKRCDAKFSCYRVKKSDLAIIQAFDHIFDSGVNEAVKPEYYNNIIKRNIILILLSKLFETSDVTHAHKFMTGRSPSEQSKNLVDLCQSLLNKTKDSNYGTKIKRIIKSALRWAAKNPLKIILDNNRIKNEHPSIFTTPLSMQSSPNIIGFQFVLFGIGDTIQNTGNEPPSIIIDRQLEFNRGQLDIARFYQEFKKIESPWIPYEQNIAFNNTPAPDSIEFKSSDQSPGLELTDVMLWIYKKIWEGNYKGDTKIELYQWLKSETRGLLEVSLDALEQKTQHQMQAQNLNA